MTLPAFATEPLGFPWQTRDPFLFCVHHLDDYPAGNDQLGAAALLDDRAMGMDFQLRDGWRMYHGRSLPGFPQHPHRGFETITVARQDHIDHTDSLGAAARFGEGDVQWMTAGSGIVHSEMFPLLRSDERNPVELFQIWLNLPARNKMVEPHFSMLWGHTIPRLHDGNDAAPSVDVAVVAGSLADATAPPPTPSSWASQPGSEVAIWTLRLDASATYTLPAAVGETVNRSLYFFAGDSIMVNGRLLDQHCACHFDTAGQISLQSGPRATELLLLQGAPIDEPVAQQGPFVMNSHAELSQAFSDYQRTQFGELAESMADPVENALLPPPPSPTPAAKRSEVPQTA